MRKKELGCRFHERSISNFKKSCEVRIRVSSRTLCDVGGNGNGCPANLIDQTEAFFFGKCLCAFVNKAVQAAGIMPDIELFKAE